MSKLDTLFDPKLMGKNPSYTASEAEVKAFAEANNLEIVYPTKYQVQVDIDSPQLPEFFYDHLNMIEEAGFAIKKIDIANSRSGNKHVTVTFYKTVNPMRQLLLEAILGGDLKRVAINFKKQMLGVGVKPFLFRPKSVPVLLDDHDDLPF